MKKNTKPFLGSTTNIDCGFPGIKEINITISQDPYGEYCQFDWQRVEQFTKSTLPRKIYCKNQKCQQGGIDLQSIILSHSNGEFDVPCSGHEGSPAGRRRGDPCDNHFKIKLFFERQSS